MTDKNISQLPLASDPVASTGLLELDNGQSVAVSLAQIADTVSLALALGSAAQSQASDFDAAGAAAAAQAASDPAGSAASAQAAAIAASDAAGSAAAVLLTSAQKANNLSDLTSASVARTNLGLGNSATRAVGTTAGTVAAGDDSRITGAVQSSSIGVANGVASLDSGGKLTSSQIPASLVGAVVYQGTWNAATNTPSLASGIGTKGWYYKVSVAGSTSIDGIGTWAIGDTIIFDGTVWDKIEGQGGVESVNGHTGPSVTLAASDVGALATASNLSDLGNAGTARTNLGLGSIATHPTTDFDAAGAAAAVQTASLQKSSNLSDLTSAATARTNLSLGGAATLSVGTTAGTVAAGDDSRITGAVQASSFTGKGVTLAGTGSGTLAALAAGTNGNVMTADSAQTNGVKWATPAAFDVTSRIQTRNSITGTATLTNADTNKIHTCTGTSADYTVNLPTSGLTAGDIISFVMDAALTKLVTLNAGTAKINNVTTRVLWANESATLQWDGANWTKIAGLTIPMVCLLTASSTQSVNDSTVTSVLVDTAEINVGGMAVAASHKITTRRAGNYRIGFLVGYTIGASDMPIVKHYAVINSVNYPVESAYKTMTSVDIGDLCYSRMVNIAAAKDIVLNTYQQSAGAAAKQTGTNGTFLSAEEIVSW